MTPSPVLGRLKIFCPALERSAHTAVGQVIITTCTVSTLSHSGLFRKPHKDAYQDLTKLKFQPRKYLCSFQKSLYKFRFGDSSLGVVLTRAVDRRRMERRVRAEVKVVSLLTLASFLIST